jgi:predicted phage baseplate assembly protein
VCLAALDTDGGLVATSTATQNDAKLPLVEVTWRAQDALTFPLCLAATLNNGTRLPAVSLARGNIVAADHGRTITEVREFAQPLGGDRQRFTLSHAPLTIVPSSRSGPADDTNSSVTLKVTHTGATDDWSQLPSLLTSRDTGRHFVVDVDHRGRGILRFGDGEYGRVLVDATRFDLTYRIGNGPAGNIGAQSIRHVVLSGNPTDPKVLGVYNPLPAVGGIEPETIEEVRQLAPAAFRTQRRAVTAEDYRDLAKTIPGVAGAVAAFMWTGSWYTALVGIDPADPADLDPDQPSRLAPTLRERVIDALNGYRLAGYDLEVRGATYVPIDIKLTVCVKAGYFRGDVARAVALVLAGAQPGTAGLFNPSRFTFGQPVYLSSVYAAAESVPGVESVYATAFQRHGRLPAAELDEGLITIGAWEIAQLDNDANCVENGVLTVTAGGGS